MDCEPNRRDLQAKRTATPLVAMFCAPDEREDVSVSVRGANTLKLTFLQIKDVTEFGDVNEAAPRFVPPGCARLVSATARVSPRGNPPDNVDKSYYTYDFGGRGRVSS